MERLRKAILRSLVVVGFPANYCLFWLIGGPHWQNEFWTAARTMWRAERK
jgi:hypothetical protein